MLGGDGQRRFFGAAGDPRASYGAPSGASSPNLEATYLGDEDSARGIALHGTNPEGANVRYRDDPTAAAQEQEGGGGITVADESYRNSGDAFDKEAVDQGANMRKRDRMLAGYAGGRGGNPRRNKFIIGGIVLALIIILAVAIPVAVTHKKSSPSSSASSPPGSSPSASASPTSGGPGQDPPGALTKGGDGSTITTDTGATFTYKNSFGGTWVDDPDDPFNNNAQAQSWTPPLNQTWDWSKNRIFGCVFSSRPFALSQRF